VLDDESAAKVRETVETFKRTLFAAHLESGSVKKA
jgi:hypothetical protein